MSVYVLQRASGLIKIGYSDQPEVRFIQLCRHYREILKKLGLAQFGSASHERELHRMLAKASADESEWFHPTPLVLKAVAIFPAWPETPWPWSSRHVRRRGPRPSLIVQGNMLVPIREIAA